MATDRFLDPEYTPGFNSLRSACDFARGFCSRRVVVCKRRTRVEPFVVISASTARRRNLPVLSIDGLGLTDDAKRLGYRS